MEAAMKAFADLDELMLIREALDTLAPNWHSSTVDAEDDDEAEGDEAEDDDAAGETDDDDDEAEEEDDESLEGQSSMERRRLRWMRESKAERAQSEERAIALAALSLGVALCAKRQRPETAGMLLCVLRVCDADLIEWDETPDVAARGLARLVSAGAALDAAQFLELVESNDGATYRMAATLLPNSPLALTALQRMANSTDPLVRRQALKSLGPAHRPAWWAGVLDADPAQVLTPEALAAADPQLRALADMLANVEGWQTIQSHELITVLVTLPDALAIPAARRMLTTKGYRQDEEIAALVGVLCRADDVPGQIQQVLNALPEMGRWDRHQLASRIVKAVTAEHALTVGLMLAAEALRHSDEGDMYGQAAQYAEAMAAVWPADAPLDALLDLLDAASPDVTDARMIDYSGPSWNSVLGASRPSTQSPLRILTALQANWPGHWARFQTPLQGHLATAPTELLRSTMAACLDAPDQSTRRWALREWCGRLHDPDRDPPLTQLAWTIWQHPQWRDDAIDAHDLRQFVLGPAREALRAGQLNLEMAVRVHEWIQNRFGGGLWMDGDRPVMTTDPDSPEAQSLPAEFAGPMSALERSHLRRVIDASLATGSDEHLHEAIQTLDTTPWTDADRHIRDRAVAAVLAGQKHYVWLFSWALAMKSGPEDLPLFEQLKSVLRGEVRSEVAEQALRFRLRHGLKAPRRGTKPAPAATSERVVGTGQWMDEDD